MYIFLDVDGVLNTEADWTTDSYQVTEMFINNRDRILSRLLES